MTAEQARKSPAKGRGGLTWFTPGRFALLLGVLFFACFPQIILGLETFAYGDFGQFAYPVAFYHREAFWRGEWPLWNPLNSCGIPFLAQWNTLTLYPPSLFYLLFPLPWSFNVFCLGHLFLGGLGMYFLARRWTGHPLASALAGTVFAFNGLTWYGIMWPHLDAALGWMPWVILAIERACQEGGRNLVFASLAGGVQMLSGGAEVIIQTWFVAGVSCAFRIHNHNQDGSGKPVASHIWAFARFFAVVVLVAGLAAVQLAPFIDLLSHSQRSSQYGSSAVPGLEAMPLTGWANYLVPLFHCFRNPEGVFLQLSQTWTGSYYLGTGILALALFAAWGVRHRRVWLLAGLTLFALLLALGDRGLVYGWTRAVLPFISIMRFPIKFVMLTTFSIPLLAAFGLARLLEIPAEEWPREWRRAKYVGGGLLGTDNRVSVRRLEISGDEGRSKRRRYECLKPRPFPGLVPVLGCSFAPQPPAGVGCSPFRFRRKGQNQHLAASRPHRSSLVRTSLLTSRIRALRPRRGSSRPTAFAGTSGGRGCSSPALPAPWSARMRFGKSSPEARKIPSWISTPGGWRSF